MKEFLNSLENRYIFLKPIISSLKSGISIESSIFAMNESYTPFLCVYALLTFALLYKEWSVLQIVTGIFVITYYIYFVHRFSHALPIEGIWKYLNYHPGIHHLGNGGPLGIALESMINMLFFSGIFLIQYFTDTWLVPAYMILMVSISYTSIHAINYSIIGSKSHAKHHADESVNFTPDYLDHIFGTNADKTYENLSDSIPNIVAGFIAAYFVKNGCLPFVPAKW
jgi:hypothetical protein